MSKTRAMIPWRGGLFLASLILWPVLLVEGAASPLEPAAARNRPNQTADSAPTTLPEGLRQTLRSRLQVIEPDWEDARAWRTLNIGQELSIRFEQSGVRVSPQKGKDTWRWGMELSGYGYLGNLKPVATAKMHTDGNRIEYRRGDLTEWYVNDARGLEQGFTLAKPPEGGQVANKPLVLEFALSGGLRPLPDKDGLGIRFTDKDDRAALNYTGLQAFDAEGRTLVARLTVQSERLRIEVDDQRATYPITIDPWVQRAKLLASDGAASDYFGNSVSISGDTAIAGASGDNDNGNASGSAYVFVRDSGTGAWTQQQKLTASDGAASDTFGDSVSISGDTAIAGALGDSDNGVGSGSAYVFVRDPGTGVWTQQQKLLASDGTWGDWFGASVSIGGDTVIVGAYGDDDNGGSSGSAYIFVRDPGTGAWTQQQKLLASDGATNDYLGYSVSISGDSAIAGAHQDTDNGSYSGSAYVFVRDPATGFWTEQQKLLPSDGAAGDDFGRSVSISGDSAIAGADTDGDNGLWSGSAYVFVRDPGTGVWTEQQKLLASDGAASDYFGNSVSISGDTAIVGSYYDDDNGNASGSAYLFVRDPGTGVWTEQQKLTASDGAASDRFGSSVSISGDTAIAGADEDDDNGNNSGSAYVFTIKTFADVLSSHWAYTWIEAVAGLGIDGCGGGNFCPEQLATRDLAALWLVKAVAGVGYTPGAAGGGVYGDVGAADFNADWIEDLANRGLTDGCGGGNYCPQQAVTKDQVAMLLLKALYGSAYTPPAASGTVYNDVAAGDFNAAWIEDMANKGYAEGCDASNYCPQEGLSLAGFAKLLTKTFGLVP